MYEEEKKNIDLSHSFDDVVEKRQEKYYQRPPRKKSSKKMIYIIIIIVSWIVMAITILLYNKDVQTEKFISPDELMRQYYQQQH
jgi:preprotein translocase subunit Sec63